MLACNDPYHTFAMIGRAFIGDGKQAKVAVFDGFTNDADASEWTVQLFDEVIEAGGGVRRDMSDPK